MCTSEIKRKFENTEIVLPLLWQLTAISYQIILNKCYENIHSRHIKTLQCKGEQ